MRSPARAAAAAALATCLAGGVLGAVGGVASAAQSPRPMLGGWFGYWATDADIHAMTTDANGVVTEVSMFWWSFQGKDQPLCTFNNDGGPSCARGSDTPWTTPRFATMLDQLHAAGIRVQASITDVSGSTAGELTSYLATDKRRKAYVAQIVDWATKAGVDGVDLDWENFAFNDGRDSWTATKERWVAFITLLGPALHEAGLTLSATVPGGVAINDTNTGYWVYAWQDIIDYVDRLQIMAYDYHGPWSEPGAIGPNDWARNVVARAVADVGPANARKVWIGQPQYGRDWPVMGANGWASDRLCPEGWKPDATPYVDTVSPEQARDTAATEKVQPTWDEPTGEWTFTYGIKTAGTFMKKVKGEKKPVKTARACSVKHVVWYGDTRSALARAQLVPDFKIGGIVIWDFSTVPDDFYQELARFGAGIAPAPTMVSLAAPALIVHGDQARVKVKATSPGKPTAGALASLYWRSHRDGAARRLIDTAKLDKNGAHVFSATAEENGEWIVSVAGTYARRAGQSEPVETRVQQAVTADQESLAPKVGLEVPLAATVAPAVAGVNVVLQRQTAAGWTTLRTLTTDKGGRVETSVRPIVAKETNYRFLAKRSATNAWGMSSIITLHVQARYLVAATVS